MRQGTRSIPGARLFRFLFWGALAFSFVMATIPYQIALPGAPADKIQHIIAFLALGALGAVSFPSVPRLRLIALLSAYGALIEFVQAVPGLNRDGNFLDWLVDTLSAAISVILFSGRRQVTRN